MRARSAYLMTSWWVVGVWVVLTILTGVISVISVLQPTWYVRYTLVHAQALQDVTFQVVVSSVGPLGFCRLMSVETHPVIDVNSAPYIPEKTFSTVKDDLERTTNAVKPTESFKPTDPTTTPEFVTRPSQVAGKLGNDEFGLTRTTVAPPEDFPTEGETDGSLLEWPPTTSSPVGGDGVEDINSSLFLPFTSSSPPNPTAGDAEEKSGRFGSETSELFPDFPATDKSLTARKSDGIKNVLFSVTEKYANVLYEEQERSVDAGPDVDEGDRTTLREGEGIGMSKSGNSISEKAFEIHSGQDIGDSVRQVVDNELESVRDNATGSKELNFHKREKDGHTSYRRRRRKKKKKKKKKRRNKKKSKNKLGKENSREVEVSTHDILAVEIFDIMPTTPTDIINDTFLNRYQGQRINLSIIEEITAAFLIQQEKPTAFERSTFGLNYRPRMPILACSGLTVGVGSGSSAVWVLVGVVYGVAGVVQVLAGVASIITQTVGSPTGRYGHAIWVGNVQVAVVMSQGVTLVLFPLGLGSPLARVECGGSSSVYWSGDCTFGWAYMLAIVGTTLAAYCPCLARLTVYKKYALREWESLNFF